MKKNTKWEIIITSICVQNNFGVAVWCVCIRHASEALKSFFSKQQTNPKTLENIITYAIYHCAQRVWICVYDGCTPICLFCTIHSNRSHFGSPQCVFVYSPCLASMCIHAICVNEKPERTQSFFSSFTLCCYPYNLSIKYTLAWKVYGMLKKKRFFFAKATNRPEKNSVFHVRCLKILIARRPVALSFRSKR